MIYALVYLIMSAAYGYYVFRNNPQKNEISSLTLMVFGTTWGLHLVINVLILLYNLFGVKIYYMVGVNKEKKK